MTWAEGRHLTDWATQAPPFCILFYLWCRVWIQVHSFCIWISSCPRTFVEKAVFSLLHAICIFVRISWPYMCGFIYGLFSVPLISVPFITPISCCFNYYQFIIIFELRWLVLVLQFCSLSGFFCYSRSFVFPHEFYLFYLFILSTCIVESTCHFLREKTLVVFWKSGLDYVESTD